MKRALRINTLIGVGIGLILLICVFIGISDIPIIITAFLAYGIALPLQFNKLLSPHDAMALETGIIITVYGWRYWLKFLFAILLAMICALFVLANRDVSELNAFTAGMAFSGIFISFVNPKYVRQNLPTTDDFG